MNCPEVMELMQRHVDGDLNAEETSHMLDHVGHCPDCAAMLQRLLHLSRGLEQLPRVVPPYSLVDAILPQLGNGEAAGAETADDTVVLAPSERRAARSRREWMGRLSGVAAVAIVVGLLLVGGPSLFRKPAPRKSRHCPATRINTKMLRRKRT
jgi:anti-sigma factor RsiW